MSKIGSFAGLEELDLSFTQVQGGDFEGINRSSIRKLNVGETNFGIDGFAALKNMKDLEELNVYRSGLVEHTKCNVFKSMPETADPERWRQPNHRCRIEGVLQRAPFARRTAVAQLQSGF